MGRKVSARQGLRTCTLPPLSASVLPPYNISSPRPPSPVPSLLLPLQNNTLRPRLPLPPPAPAPPLCSCPTTKCRVPAPQPAPAPSLFPPPPKNLKPLAPSFCLPPPTHTTTCPVPRPRLPLPPPSASLSNKMPRLPPPTCACPLPLLPSPSPKHAPLHAPLPLPPLPTCRPIGFPPLDKRFDPTLTGPNFIFISGIGYLFATCTQSWDVQVWTDMCEVCGRGGV